MNLGRRGRTRNAAEELLRQPAVEPDAKRLLELTLQMNRLPVGKENRLRMPEDGRKSS
jgi:hypothetical protein